MRYRIEYLGPGFTAWQGFTIRNVEQYKDKSRIPTFNTDDTPITEGLKLLEKGGKIKIVDLDAEVEEPIDEKVDEPVDNKEPTEDAPTENTGETADAPAENTGETADAPAETTEETVEEVDSTVKVETKTVELEGVESELTEKDLKDTFTSDELDDVCKKYEISGYSQLNKGEKAKLIVEELA